jgi:biopolymer transport protein TolR
MADDERPRRAPSLTPDINVTPLVDVVLVLLIIFMVVTPQVDAGAHIDLPSAKTAQTKGASDEKPAQVALARDGALYFDTVAVPEAEIDAKLKAFATAHPDMKLVVKADRQASYGTVRSLFKRCQTAGIAGVSLEVVERANQAPGI